MSFIYWILINFSCKEYIFLTKEDKSETNPWSVVLSCSSYPTQSFFYITESGFSHLKRRLLHFPACLSLRLLKLSKPSLPFLVVPQKGEETGEEGGWSFSESKKKRGSRNELLYMNMEERAALCDSKTKGCYLHGPHLTLDFVLLREGDDDCFFPFIPPPLPHS